MGNVCSTNGEKMGVYRILVGTPEERDHEEQQDVGGWIILKWILGRYVRVVWTGLIRVRIATDRGLL
jgi:hypothetical protein